MTELIIAKDIQVLISPQDLSICLKYKWHVMNSGYVVTYIAAGKYKQICLFMHNLIMQPEPHLTVDHINGLKLDNRRENLRICTHSENSAARQVKTNSSGFRGVSRHGTNWRAQIVVNYKHINLGTFKSAKEAAKAYDKAAREFFREFARLNFTEETIN